MANKEELLDDFKKLIGENDEKPFECVGSREEINFSAVLQKALRSELNL